MFALEKEEFPKISRACDHTLKFREIYTTTHPDPPSTGVHTVTVDTQVTARTTTRRRALRPPEKNSTRKLTFSPSGNVGSSGYRYAQWEDRPHKKRREASAGG